MLDVIGAGSGLKLTRGTGIRTGAAGLFRPMFWAAQGDATKPNRTKIGRYTALAKIPPKLRTNTRRLPAQSALSSRFRLCSIVCTGNYQANEWSAQLFGRA